MQEIYNRFRSKLLDSCVPFWLENAVDTRYGGYGTANSFNTDTWVSDSGKTIEELVG